MLDRPQTILKIVCLALGVLLLIQLARKERGPDPLARLTTVATQVSAQIASPPENSSSTNSTPSSSPNTTTNTNSTPQTNTTTNATPNPHPNSTAQPGPGPRPGPMPGGRPGPGGAPARPVPELPSTVQAGIDRIHTSEIFGPIPRPTPMGLIGIAGQDAIIRAPNGQTQLMKVGDEVGGVKLLRIGTNRVLVEHEGEKKELNIFSGFGSESLLNN